MTYVAKHASQERWNEPQSYLAHGFTRAVVKILFVDDETHVLDGLRRAMYGMRGQWNMSFATSAAQALSMLGDSPADVVVADMRMPGATGRDLLMDVKRLYPQAVRFILSGYAESSSVMQVASTAHQYLSKPCDVTTLKTAITRAFALRRLLKDERLVRRIGRVDTLPSLPSVYQRIMACLQGPDPELSEIASIISGDLVMTAMVLKLANSGFFGAGRTFKTADRAVSFLGLDTIAGLVLGHSIFTDASFENADVDLGKLWQESLLTAAAARAVALCEKWSTDRAEEAFLVGVLHDLGKLVLATRPCTPAEESDAIGTGSNPALAGAYLLGLWGFSDEVIEAIALHPTPSLATVKEFGLAGVLHVAKCFTRAASTEDLATVAAELEPGYLESLQMDGRLCEWQAAWRQITPARG